MLLLLLVILILSSYLTYKVGKSTTHYFFFLNGEELYNTLLPFVKDITIFFLIIVIFSGITVKVIQIHTHNEVIANENIIREYGNKKTTTISPPPIPIVIDVNSGYVKLRQYKNMEKLQQLKAKEKSYSQILDLICFPF